VNLLEPGWLEPTVTTLWLSPFEGLLFQQAAGQQKSRLESSGL
jgi:hypothetical protein